MQLYDGKVITETANKLFFCEAEIGEDDVSSDQIDTGLDVSSGFFLHDYYYLCH